MAKALARFNPLSSIFHPPSSILHFLPDLLAESDLTSRTGGCGICLGLMESTILPETQHGAGFESPRVRQFTIFLENKVGRLQTLVRSLEQGVGRIVALSIEESGDAALVRLICAEPDYGRELLQTAQFAFSESELLAVELPKSSRQPLLAVCSALLAAEINIHYAYPLLSRPHGPTIALYVDDITLSTQLLIKKGFNLVSQSDLGR